MAKNTVITIKQHPVVIIRNLLIMQLMAYAVFVAIGALADYGAIYHGLSFGKIISYQFVYFFAIALGEALLTLLIFLSWSFAYYQLSSREVFIAGGIVRRRKTAVPTGDIDVVSHEYTALGKFLKYGTVRVATRTGKTFRLKFVATPERYVNILKRMKAGEFGKAALPEVPLVTDPSDLLHKEENDRLEFKTTMRFDVHTGQVNKQLEKVVMKTVAAFLNSNGGHLVLGVDDRRNVVGLHHDYASLTRQDQDGFENHFTHAFNSMIGAQFRGFVKLQFAQAGGKDVCIVHVQPATRPVYVRFDKAEEFYVRTGNSTTPLSLSEAASYLALNRRRFS